MTPRTTVRVDDSSTYRLGSANFLFLIFYFFVNLVYRAKIEIHVTRTKRCLGLRARRRCSRYCPSLAGTLAADLRHWVV